MGPFSQRKAIAVMAARPLRRALWTNAVFSLLSGVLMLFFSVAVGEWLGIQAPFALQVIGAGLVAFGADLMHQATRPRVATWRALIASAADLTWVAGTVILLLAFPQQLSRTGGVLVVAVAAAVFVFGAWQILAIGQAHRVAAGGPYRHCIIVETSVSAARMWQVVGNIGDIKEYMTSLKHSAVVDGKAPGVGAVRICEDRAGRRWSEECTAFNPGRAFAVRFRSEAPHFPFPVTSMHGGWDVTPAEAGSQVRVWWELTPRSSLLAPVVLPLLAFQADRDFPEVIRRMASAAMGQDNERTMRSSGGVICRILPSAC